MIDSKFRLIIADFGFAIQLPSENFQGLQNKNQNYEGSPKQGSPRGLGFGYERYIYRNRMVGSEDYNAPEIFSEEVFSDI